MSAHAGCHAEQVRSGHRLGRRCTLNLSAALVLGFLGMVRTAQAAQPPDEFESLLAFESSEQKLTERWSGFSENRVRLDEQVVHEGKRSARIDRDGGTAGEFTALGMGLPVNFNVRKVELRGWLRTQDVAGFAGLWLRTNSGAHVQGLDNMSKRRLNGTNDWAEFSVTLPADADTDSVVFGALLVGTGKVWVDALQLLVDGQPVRPIAGASKPQEADSGESGSRVRIAHLDRQRIQGLHLLGRVWGFLKYHHPRVMAGDISWDAELLRMLPLITEARDATEVERRIIEWLDSLGEVSPCNPCAELRQERLQLAPAAWLDDEKVASDALRARLRAVLANRGPNRQFYASRTLAGNVAFENESDYARMPFPDAGLQLLGLFRFWSAVEYWFPYRAQIDGDWGETLREFIPRMAKADTRNAYQLELMALIARVGDSHANLWSSIAARPPVGPCQLPVNVRFIEGLPVVTGFSGSHGPFQRGDVFERLDGALVRKQIERWRPYYSGSNEASRLRDIGRFMTRGECGPMTVVVRRERRLMELRSERLPREALDLKSSTSNELEGVAFRMLSPQVAYIKASTFKVDEIPASLQAARDATAIIVDLRGYPSEFLVFKLGGHFVKEPTAFVRFALPDLSNPGAFNWLDPMSLQPEAPHYQGQLIVLVDESTQSQAEYTAMALRAAPRAKVVGSTTAGADGNISRLSLPGGMWTFISGLGVYYPDNRPTQRVGIVPDVEVRSTVKGIRRGEDEVLAAALKLIHAPGN